MLRYAPIHGLLHSRYIISTTTNNWHLVYVNKIQTQYNSMDKNLSYKDGLV